MTMQQLTTPIFQQQPDRFKVWLVSSLVVHVSVLMIHFSGWMPSRLDFSDAPLDIVLINETQERENLSPDVFAQGHLIGGGEGDEGRLKSPLPNQDENVDGQVLTALMQRRQALEEEQRVLLVQLRAQMDVAKAKLKQHNEASSDKTTEQDEVVQAEVLRLKRMAEIAKQIEDYQKKPKRENFSVSARKVVYAHYYQQIKAEIERLGTMQFPKNSQGDPLYGSLIVTFSVWSDGRLMGIEINRSSGQKILDQAAVVTIRKAMPFEPFPLEMKQLIDIFDITTTFTYSRSEGLNLEQTTVSSASSSQ